jgi:AP-1 complex subunit mu
LQDFGYPQISEVKVLKEYITQGAHKLAVTKPPQAVTNIVSWRTEGIKYKKNEVFLDVVERLNLLVAANGSVLSSEILGSIKMRSFLSGMPELK